MRHFDPDSAPEAGSGIFGLPHTEEESALVFLPVPWEATTSYGGGTSRGPEAMLEASGQIDLNDMDVEKPYEPGMHMRPVSKQVLSWSKQAKAAAQKVIAAGGRVEGRKSLKAALETANGLGGKLNGWVYEQTRDLLGKGKIVGVVGGDHSVPLGAFKAAAEAYGPYGLLHFDAHSDTRDAYEGFVHSHASIMRNALDDIPGITKLTQVGIRDYCGEEQRYLDGLGARARVFFERDLNARRFAGEPWTKISKSIVDTLPKQVWVTFDIDGLDPKLCPHTGTPVPGGLQFAEAVHVIEQLARSGRKILGFDLVEVSPSPDKRDEWDANVGMRLLYKLAAWTFVSRGLCKPRA